MTTFIGGIMSPHLFYIVPMTIIFGGYIVSLLVLTFQQGGLNDEISIAENNRRLNIAHTTFIILLSLFVICFLGGVMVYRHCVLHIH